MLLGPLCWLQGGQVCSRGISGSVLSPHLQHAVPALMITAAVVAAGLMKKMLANC